MRDPFMMLPMICLLFAGCGESGDAPARAAAEVKFSDDLGDECCEIAGQAGGGLDEFAADIRRILPDFSGFGRRAGREVALLDKEGRTIGSLRLAPEKYRRVEGYNDVINTAVVLVDGRISGVAIGKNAETPRFLERVRRGGLLERWNGRRLSEAAGLEVDAVTGATYSSEAIKGEVRAIAR